MTPKPRGKQWEALPNVRSLREDGQIEILQKAEPVQRQRDHTALFGSRTLTRGVLIHQSLAGQTFTSPSRQLDGRDATPTYRIECLTDKGRSSELRPATTSALHMTLSRISISTIILR